MLPSFDTLTSLPALEHPELLAEPTFAALQSWAQSNPQVATDVAVCAVDAQVADTAALTETYQLPLEVSVNCVIVAGKRDGVPRVAAAVVRATTRADVNTVIRKTLNVRKASFIPTERAVAETGMEYGGITPIGLPDSWRVLMDRQAVEGGVAIIGSGIRKSKIILPGELLGQLPGAEVIEKLAMPARD